MAVEVGDVFVLVVVIKVVTGFLVEMFLADDV